MGVRVIGICALFAAAFVVTGCAPAGGPSYLTLGADRYDPAFDAAAQAAREAGMAPALLDRRHGTIDTQPVAAASIMEPWRGGNASFGQAVENTIAFQRRRARFEFAPVDQDGAGQRSELPEALGPDLLGLRTPQRDLTEYDGALELRVTVTLERAHMPGLRRSTWSRSLTTRTAIITSSGPQPAVFWEPVARDTAFERRLLAAVRETLAQRTDR
ncbi:MAG: hypothetical protein ACYSTY_15220 [Planctomycetota bacterium]|jgi:hypothetical protein